VFCVEVGTNDGGRVEGKADGTFVGRELGCDDGNLVGSWDATFVGLDVGSELGFGVAIVLDRLEGIMDGITDSIGLG
jgi:hypothetical protein